MSSKEGQQNKSPRRHPRQPKAITKAPSSGTPAAVETPTKPKIILQRGSSNVLQALDGGISTFFAPSTPPRPKSLYDSPPDGHLSPEVSNTEEIKKGEQADGPKLPKINRTGIPRPNSNSTPQPPFRPITLTPGRSSATPLQAYAGPTFHASPAASALPIPKFFSKSVPAANTGTSLKTMMEKEALEAPKKTPSDRSGDSPTLAKAQRIGEDQVREESPLDVFFRADREEKEKKRGDSGDAAAGYEAQAVGQSSPTKSFVRHHSRHVTDSSIGEMFSLDIDDKSLNDTPIQEDSKVLSASGSNSPHPTNAPLEPMVQLSEEVQRKRKTELLKKLLMTPQPQRPATASPHLVKAFNTNGSAKTCLPQRQRSPFYNPSQSPTPAPYLRSEASDQTLKQTISLSQDSKATSIGSPHSRPASSKLRKEDALKSPAGANASGFPATPPPIRKTNSYNSPNRKNLSLNGRFSSFASGLPTLGNSSRTGTNAAPVGQGHEEIKRMQDDLRRRILNLDLQGSEGVDGIRS